MKTFTLTHSEPAFEIRGNEAEMSAEILKVIIKEATPGLNLKLIVHDENGLEVYSKILQPKPPYPDAVQFNRFPEVPVNKRIIFNAFIIVSIETSTPQPFVLEVQYV